MRIRPESQNLQARLCLHHYMHQSNVIKHLNHSYLPVPHNRWHSTHCTTKYCNCTYLAFVWHNIWYPTAKKKTKTLKWRKADCLFSIVVQVISHNISGPIFNFSGQFHKFTNFIRGYNRHWHIQFRSAANLRRCWISLSWATFFNEKINAGKYI